MILTHFCICCCRCCCFHSLSCCTEVIIFLRKIKISTNEALVTSKCSGQTAHECCLIRAFACRIRDPSHRAKSIVSDYSVEMIRVFYISYSKIATLLEITWRGSVQLNKNINKASHAIRFPRTGSFFLLIASLGEYSVAKAHVKGIVEHNIKNNHYYLDINHRPLKHKPVQDMFILIICVFKLKKTSLQNEGARTITFFLKTATAT